MTTIAPLVFNQLPHDPALDSLDRDLEALAEKYGYTIISIAYKQDGKMMITGAGLEGAAPGSPGHLFKNNTAEFFAYTAWALRMSVAAQAAENEQAGHA